MPTRKNSEPARQLSLKQAVYWIAFDTYIGPTSAQIRQFQEDASKTSSNSLTPSEKKSSERIRLESEENAWRDLREAIGKGEIVATGRFSKQKIRLQWLVINADEAWEMHSNLPVPVVLEHWLNGNADWREGTLTFRDGQYIEVDVSEFFLQCIWPDPSLAEGMDSPKSRWPTEKPALRSAPTEYLELINKAVEHFWVDGREPSSTKTDIVEWIKKHQVDGQPPSDNLAQAIGTMILPPGLRKGGIKTRKWRNRRKEQNRL